MPDARSIRVVLVPEGDKLTLTVSAPPGMEETEMRIAKAMGEVLTAIEPSLQMGRPSYDHPVLCPYCGAKLSSHDGRALFGCAPRGEGGCGRTLYIAEAPLAPGRASARDLGPDGFHALGDCRCGGAVYEDAEGTWCSNHCENGPHLVWRIP